MSQEIVILRIIQFKNGILNAAFLQTHLAVRQEKRLIIIILNTILVFWDVQIGSHECMCKHYSLCIFKCKLPAVCSYKLLPQYTMTAVPAMSQPSHNPGIAMHFASRLTFTEKSHCVLWPFTTVLCERPGTIRGNLEAQQKPTA